MLITVSGIVGSGKSTIAKEIASLLREQNERVEVVRFQALPCFRWLTRGARTSAQHWSETAASRHRVRGEEYFRRRLTARTAFVYLARMLAFRVYRRFWLAGRSLVSNRYFYDLLAHYELRSRGERFWLALVRRCIPRPDLAILVTASPATITTRRPNYAPEYIRHVSDGYNRLREEYDELVVISTEPHQRPLEVVRSLLSSTHIASRA